MNSDKVIIIIIIELDKIDYFLPKLDRHFTSSLLLEWNYHGMYFSLFSSLSPRAHVDNKPVIVKNRHEELKANNIEVVIY